MEPPMRTYVISYDLANPFANRHVVAQAIMEAGEAWARPLESTWYIKSEDDSDEIEARLKDLLNDDDGLLVQPVRGQAVMANTTLRWFHQRRPDFELPENSNVVAFPFTIPTDVTVGESSDQPVESDISDVA